MSAFGCYIARTLHREALMALSVPQSALLGAVSGKRVAHVGTDRALAETDREPEIDAANMVRTA